MADKTESYSHWNLFKTIMAGVVTPIVTAAATAYFAASFAAKQEAAKSQETIQVWLRAEELYRRRLEEKSRQVPGAPQLDQRQVIERVIQDWQQEREPLRMTSSPVADPENPDAAAAIERWANTKR